MSSQETVDPYALDDESIQEPPKSLWNALLKIGPGIILAGSIIGTGELLLTTSLGAKYGFVFLWLILFSCIVKVFVQIELGRYSLSCGLPTLAFLDELPGPRLGANWLVWWWFIMLLATVSQLGAMVGGVGQALNLAFPQVSNWLASLFAGVWPGLAAAISQHPEYPWAMLTTVAAVLLLLSGGYRRIERVTTALVVAVTFVTVFCVSILPLTDYPVRFVDLQDGFSLKVLFLEGTAIAAAFGAFGITGVGASELYSYPYWCLEKGYARYTGRRSKDSKWVERAKGWLRVMYLDAWVSMVVFTVATVAFYVLGATVLHRQNLVPLKSEMMETLSKMYVPTFGTWTKYFFLAGAWAVLFKTLYVASASHARLSADFLGMCRVVRYTTPLLRPRWTRWFCVFYPVLGLVLYLFFRDPPGMVVFGGFFQAATLPIISGVALYLRYTRLDPRLAPSRLSDVCLWLAFLSITAVSLYAIPMWAINDLWPYVKGLLGMT